MGRRTHRIMGRKGNHLSLEGIDGDWDDELGADWDDELGAARNPRYVIDEIGQSKGSGQAVPPRRKTYEVPGAGGGRTRRTSSPNYDPVFEEKAKGKWTAAILALNEADNDLSGAGGLLVANTTGNLDRIWMYEVPRNRKLHFKPQRMRGGRDPNVQSFMLRIKDNESTPNFIDGKFQITLYSVGERNIRGILASGALQEFGEGTTQYANLTEFDKRVYYMRDLWAAEGDVIDVKINTSTALTPANSDLTIKCVEYTP